jgi:intracellular septation protein A
MGLLVWVLRDFGPLIAFWVTNRLYGFVPAIIVSMVWSVVDVVIIKLRKQQVSSFLKFSITVSLGFGLVDLYLRGPFLFRYEAVLSNLVSAAFFGLSLRRDKSIIQEFAERRAQATGKPVPINPDTIHYFRLCSGVWTAYFVLKAVLYAWVGATYDLDRALAIRVMVGNATFYPLLGGSIFLARPIIRWMQRTGRAPSTKVA